MRGAWLVFLCFCITASSHAGAQTPAAGTPISSNNYGIDLFTGPITGPGRVIGMAGAYSAIATGIDGAQFNPAGYAERAEQEIDWWEWELTGGISLGGLFGRNDVDNNGTSALATADAVRLNLSGRVQFAHLGVGLTTTIQNYTLSDDGGKSADISFVTVRAGGAYAFMEGALVLGAGVRSIALGVGDPASSTTVVNFQGIGFETGMLWRPMLQRYRIGAAFRSAVDSKPDAGGMQTTDEARVMRAQGLVLPGRVHVPWEFQGGFAYLFGERRANAPWRHTDDLKQHLKRRIETRTYVAPDTHGGAAYPGLPTDNPKAALQTAIANDREAERRYLRAQPRRYILLSADFVLSGPTERGQSVEAFLVQRRETSGRKPSYGFRAGAESEFLQDRLKMRAGSYLEPSRTNRSYYRPHATLGADVRLFDLWGWSIRGTLTTDVAPRYFDWGLSVGFWY